MAANEASAVGSLQTINTGCFVYWGTYPERGYPAKLAHLGPPATGAEPGPDAADLIDAVLVSGTESGYTFDYVSADTNADGILDAYQATASPSQPNRTGVRYFFTDQTGVIRSSTSGPATAESPPL